MSFLAVASTHEAAQSRRHISYASKQRPAKQNAATHLQRKAACACGGSCPHCAMEKMSNAEPSQQKISIGADMMPIKRQVGRIADQNSETPRYEGIKNGPNSIMANNKVYAADPKKEDINNSPKTVPPNITALQAVTAPSPTMVSGSIAITETPLSVVQQGGAILANTMGFVITKPFSVSASAQIQEPADAEPFEYGLVQNLFFDHIEEVFTEGDMLIDNVGPMVDVDPGNPSERPFIHANARMPSMLFSSLRAGASFDDRPSLEVMLNKLHCEKQKNVQLKTVKRSAQFRVGLVARGLKSKRLIPLAAIEKTYGFSWQVDFTGPAFKSTDAANLTGSYTLSPNAAAPVMDGAIAGVEGQALLNTETADFEQRCGNVL